MSIRTYLQNLILILTLIVLSSLSTVWAAAPTTFNYAGQVNVKGAPYEGNGFFRFALVNFDCTNDANSNPANCVSVWSNDGSSSSGGEPGAALERIVSNGGFDIDIGDTTISGMSALDPNSMQQTLYLRTWFDDGINGSELLVPDYKLNAAPFAVISNFAGVAANAIGYNQTWQKVARSYSKTYVNNTSRPITVNVYHSGDQTLIFNVGGVDIAKSQGNGGSSISTITAVVPKGSSYRINGPGTSITPLNWAELR